MLHLMISPSLAVACKHGKRHVSRADNVLAVSDWLNIHLLGTSLWFIEHLDRLAYFYFEMLQFAVL